MKSDISNRIKMIMEYKGMNYRSFGNFLEYSDVAVSKIIKGNSKPKFEFLSNILDKIPEINPEWLLTGKGNMIKKASSGADEAAPADKMTENLQYIIDLQKEKIERLEAELTEVKRMSRKAPANH